MVVSEESVREGGREIRSRKRFDERDEFETGEEIDAPRLAFERAEHEPDIRTVDSLAGECVDSTRESIREGDVAGVF